MGTSLIRKNVFFAQITSPPTLPPIRASCTTFFLTSKTTFIARITEPSNDDYNNDVSDNCDHNFGTFDDFGVKDDQKVSHNMIVMSKSHILKAKKIAEPPFQSKQICGKSA